MSETSVAEMFTEAVLDAIPGHDRAEAERKREALNALRRSGLESDETAIDALIELEDGADKGENSWT